MPSTPSISTVAADRMAATVTAHRATRVVVGQRDPLGTGGLEQELVVEADHVVDDVPSVPAIAG